MDIRNELNTWVLDAEYIAEDGGDYGKTINRIISEMDQKGGKLLIGSKDYKISTQVNVIKNLTISGNGSSDFYSNNWQSAFWTDSPTLKLFVVSVVCKIVIQDVHFYNTSVNAPTAGCAIQLKGTNSSGLNAIVMRSEFNRISVSGFFDNLFFDGACQWNLSSSNIHGHERYGLYIACHQFEDAGDSSIIGCDFWGKTSNRTSQAHIFQQSSGGLKLIGNKFNAYVDYCFYGQLRSSSTSILLITGNSFENFKIGAVKIVSDGGSYPFRLISIGDNQFSSYHNGTTDVDLKFVKGFSVIGNVFNNDFGGATRAINMNTSTIGRLMNTYVNYGNPVNKFNCTDVQESALQEVVSTNIDI